MQKQVRQWRKVCKVSFFFSFSANICHQQTASIYLWSTGCPRFSDYSEKDCFWKMLHTLTGCAVLPLSNQSYHHYWSSHRIDWKLCSQLCFDAEKYNIQITKVHSGSVLTTVLSSSQTKQVTIATTKAIVHAVACATCIGHVGYHFRAKLAAKCCSY